MKKINPDSVILDRLRYSVTGARIPDIQMHLYSEARQKLLSDLNRVFPKLPEFLPLNVTRYAECLGGKNCGLRFVCEGCWYRSIVWPMVDRLLDENHKPRIPFEEDNLYVVTFTGLASYQTRTFDGALQFVKFSNDWFKRLVSRAVFRKGGVITGGSAYWYPYRFPRHDKFDQHVHDRRFAFSDAMLCHVGWAPKAVMMLRTAFPISARELRRYLVCALGWLRSFTDDEIKQDPVKKTILGLQSVGNFMPEGEPNHFKCQVKVRRVSALEEGIVRYATGRLMPLAGVKRRNPYNRNDSERLNNRNRVRRTPTSYGTRVNRNLRLSLLECDPAEAAPLLAVLCGLSVHRDKSIQSSFGNFLNKGRPENAWLNLTGPIRRPGMSDNILKLLGLDRAPTTDEELKEFKKRLNRVKRKDANRLSNSFLKYAVCSDCRLSKRQIAEWTLKNRP